MARHRKTHMQTGETVEAYGRPEKVLLCGISPSFLNATTANPQHVKCPDCSRALADKAMAARGADAPTLALRKLPEGQYTHYRYSYEAVLGGEVVGYIGLEGAYKHQAWRIAMITTDKDDDTKVKMGFQIEEPVEGKDYTRDLSYASKESALADIPRLVEKKLLMSVAATVADAQAWRARCADNERRNAEADAYEAQVKADTLKGLQEIAERVEAGEITLSNFQREALQNAVLRYRGKAR